MKKLTSIILSLVMLLSAIITVNAASFKDVKSSDWYYSSVNYVAEQGIMNGTSSTKFSPKASLTRAMGVTLLYRVAGSPSVSGVTIPFTDVKGGQWYTDAVKWAYKNGIVTGKSDTFFHINGNITRAEFATILYRYSNSKNYKLPVNRADTFADSGKIPEWAFMAAWTMYRAEIINGRSDGSFDGNAKITRAEAAAMIERFMKAPKDGSSNNTTDTQPPIEKPDIPTTGKLVIKEKKYDYQGGHVMILNIENQTSKNLNVKISVKYLDANGKLILPENRYIEGFPANYQNYVILNPRIKFDKCTYEVKTENYTGPAFMQYYATGSNATVTAQPSIHDSNNGRDPRAELVFTYRVTCSYKGNLFYSAHFALFDTNGDLFYVNTAPTGFLMTETDDGNRPIFLTYDNVMYKNYTLPSELKGQCTGIVAITKVSDSLEDIDR